MHGKFGARELLSRLTGLRRQVRFRMIHAFSCGNGTRANVGIAARRRTFISIMLFRDAGAGRAKRTTSNCFARNAIYGRARGFSLPSRRPNPSRRQFGRVGSQGQKLRLANRQVSQPLHLPSLLQGGNGSIGGGKKPNIGVDFRPALRRTISPLAISCAGGPCMCKRLQWSGVMTITVKP